ncbi:MAG: ribbon-helix-helix protein, CopG family [bacterium]
MKSSLSIRLEPEIKMRLDRIARATARTRSYLVADAIQEYLRVNEWQVEAVQEGIRQAESGHLISHEEIRKKWEAQLEDSMD